jgi:hypothetical protein
MEKENEVFKKFTKEDFLYSLQELGLDLTDNQTIDYFLAEAAIAMKCLVENILEDKKQEASMEARCGLSALKNYVSFLTCVKEIHHKHFQE